MKEEMPTKVAEKRASKAEKLLHPPPRPRRRAGQRDDRCPCGDDPDRDARRYPKQEREGRKRNPYGGVQGDGDGRLRLRLRHGWRRPGLQQTDPAGARQDDEAR